jgi:hypothetical protein
LEAVSPALGDVIAELSADATTLGRALHPRTATSLAANLGQDEMVDEVLGTDLSPTRRSTR